MKHPLCRLKGHLWLKKSTGIALNILCIRCGRKELIFNDGKAVVLHEGCLQISKAIKKTVIYRIFSISTEFIVPAIIMIILQQPIGAILAVASTNTGVCAVLHTGFYYYVEKKVC